MKTMNCILRKIPKEIQTPPKYLRETLATAKCTKLSTFSHTLGVSDSHRECEVAVHTTLTSKREKQNPIKKIGCDRAPVWQNTTKFCEAIIFQLKNKVGKNPHSHTPTHTPTKCPKI